MTAVKRPLTYAILPVKRYSTAKTRLAGELAPGTRRALAESMVTDVLMALRRTEAAGHAFARVSRVADSEAFDALGSPTASGTACMSADCRVRSPRARRSRRRCADRSGQSCDTGGTPRDLCSSSPCASVIRGAERGDLRVLIRARRTHRR